MPRLWRVIVVMFAWLAGLWSQAAGPPPASQVMPEFGASKEEVRQRLAKKAATRGLDRVDGETKLEDRGEFYRSGHTTIPLWRLPSQFAVKYREGVDPAVANKQIRDAAAAAVQELASCKPKRLGIFSTSAEDTTAVIGQVKRSSVVEKVFPVYVYPVDHARMVATDDIILCVETEGARNALMPTLASMGIALVSQLPQKHINVYLVRLTAQAKDDALGACEKLNQLPGVKWAEPDFVREL
ncbi:MAG: hypothetical protein ACPL7D_03590, partial [Candidatus Sumerlaeaceae bacterium]